MLGLAVALALLTIFSLIIFFGVDSRGNRPWKQSTSSQFGFAISHSQSWSQSEDQSLFYLVNTKSKSKQFREYVTVTNLNPFGPSQNAKEIFEKVYTASDNSNVSNYFLKPQLTQSLETKIQNIIIDSQSAAKVSQDTTMPGPYYSSNIYILKGDKVWVIRLIASTKEELSADTQIFNSITATFKFTN